MPQMRPYENQVSPEAGIPTQQAQASDFGGPGLTNLGHAVESTGEAGGYIYRQLQALKARQATADAYVELSKANTDFTVYSTGEQQKADPADANFASRLLGNDTGTDPDPLSLKSRLDKGAEKFRDNPVAYDVYRKGAQQAIEHHTVQLAQFGAKLSGAYAVQQFRSTADAMKASVLVDPTQYNAQKTGLDNLINGETSSIPSSSRPRAYREELEGLAKNTIQGLIDQPDISQAHAAKAALDGTGEAGPFADAMANLKIEDRVQLKGHAETRIKAFETQQHQKQIAARQAIHDTGELMESNYALAFYNHYSHDPAKGPPPALPDLNSPHFLSMGTDFLNPEGVKRTLALANAYANHREHAIVSNPEVRGKLLERIGYEIGTPNKLTNPHDIDQATIDQQLSPDDNKWLRTRLDESMSSSGKKFTPQAEKVLNGLKTQISKSNPLQGVTDQSGDENFGQFKEEAYDLFAKYREENKDPAILLHKYLDEAQTKPNPEYIGNLVSKYKRTMDQSLKTLTEDMGLPPAAPKKPSVPIGEYFDKLWQGAKEKGGQAYHWMFDKKDAPSPSQTPEANAAIPPPAAPAPRSAPPEGEVAPMSQQGKDMLKRHEGFSGKPYVDTTGNVTIGRGRNLTANPLTQEEADYLMDNDIKTHRNRAAKTFPYFNALDPVRQDAVTQLTYNLGAIGLNKMKKFNNYMGMHDYDAAAETLLNTDVWVKQVGKGRAKDIADLIRSGKY